MDSLNQASVGKLEFLSGAALDSVLDSPDFTRMLQQTLLDTTQPTTVAPVLATAAKIKVDPKIKIDFKKLQEWKKIIKEALDKIEEAFNKFDAAL
jgi:hypothetical protein